MVVKKRVNIFIFIHDLAPFGAQRVALHLAGNLDPEKFRFTVCSFWGDETLAPEFERCGAEVILLKAKRFLDLSAWLRLAGLLSRHRPEIVQATLPELSIPLRVFSLFIPGLRVVHNVQNPFSSEPWYWRLLNRATLRLCDAVIFSSRGVYEESAPGLKRFSGKLSVAQNCVSLEPVSPAAGAALRRDLGINENEKVIGCVGRLTRQKGQDILIAAAARLLSGERRLRFILVGDGETLAELKEQVLRTGLEREVLFLGRRADIAQILSACDIYAAPSRWESFNIALGEAMLSGKPCVASDIPGHADLLRDGVTAAAIPAESTEALVKGISRLLESPDEAQRLGLAAKEMVSADFTVAKMTGKFEKVYLEIGQR